MDIINLIRVILQSTVNNAYTKSIPKMIEAPNIKGFTF